MKRILCIASWLFLTAFFLTAPVRASSEDTKPAESQESEREEGKSLVELSFQTLYARILNFFRSSFEMIRQIALAGSVLGLAICAFVMKGGNEEERSRAMGGIKMILIADACLYLFPLVFQLGKNLGGNLSPWDPSNLTK